VQIPNRPIVVHTHSKQRRWATGLQKRLEQSVVMQDNCAIEIVYFLLPSCATTVPVMLLIANSIGDCCPRRKQPTLRLIARSLLSRRSDAFDRTTSSSPYFRHHKRVALDELFTW